MKARAKLTDLIDSLELASDDLDYVVKYDREEGRTVMTDRSILSALEEGESEEDLADELPDWQDEQVQVAKAICEDSGDRFIEPPQKFDFHEYRHMERFIRDLPDENAAEQLWRAIKGRGAFRYFKDTSARLGLLQQWYDYRDDAMKRFVIEWAEANDVPYEDDLSARGKTRKSCDAEDKPNSH